jgi:putative tricarboxylic transport membrane protein
LINNAYSKSASLALLTITVGYGIFAREIPLDLWSLEEPINARTLPYLLAITGTILALALSVLSFLPGNAKVQAEKIPSTQNSDWISLCLMLVLMAAFAISIELMGFILSSILLLMFGFVLLGSRSPRKILLIAIPLVLLIWLILDALGIYLAKGTIFLTTALEVRDLNRV